MGAGRKRVVSAWWEGPPGEVEMGEEREGVGTRVEEMRVQQAADGMSASPNAKRVKIHNKDAAAR